MQKRYTCKNGIEEVTQFTIGDNAQVQKHWRKADGKKQEAEKREDNKRQAIKELARIFNCNLDPSGYFVKLDYTPAAYDRIFDGMDEDQILREAGRQGQLFLRRLHRRAPEAKIVVLASDRGWDEENNLTPVRIHHHVVVMGATKEQIRESWTLGENTHIQSLYEQQDYTGLAAYCLGQVRSLPKMRKYSCTRNMEKPKISYRVVRGAPDQEIRVQTGARIMDRMPYHEGSLVQYVRYVKRPRQRKRGGHKLPPAEEKQEGGQGFDFSQAAWG